MWCAYSVRVRAILVALFGMTLVFHSASAACDISNGRRICQIKTKDDCLAFRTSFASHHCMAAYTAVTEVLNRVAKVASTGHKGGYFEYYEPIAASKSCFEVQSPAVWNMSLPVSVGKPVCNFLSAVSSPGDLGYLEARTLNTSVRVGIGRRFGDIFRSFLTPDIHRMRRFAKVSVYWDSVLRSLSPSRSFPLLNRPFDLRRESMYTPHGLKGTKYSGLKSGAGGGWGGALVLQDGTVLHTFGGGGGGGFQTSQALTNVISEGGVGAKLLDDTKYPSGIGFQAYSASDKQIPTYHYIPQKKTNSYNTTVIRDYVNGMKDLYKKLGRVYATGGFSLEGGGGGGGSLSFLYNGTILPSSLAFESGFAFKYVFANDATVQRSLNLTDKSLYLYHLGGLFAQGAEYAQHACNGLGDTTCFCKENQNFVRAESSKYVNVLPSWLQEGWAC